MIDQVFKFSLEISSFAADAIKPRNKGDGRCGLERNSG